MIFGKVIALVFVYYLLPITLLPIITITRPITYCSTGGENFEKLLPIEKFKNFNHLSRPKRE